MRRLRLSRQRAVPKERCAEPQSDSDLPRAALADCAGARESFPDHSRNAHRRPPMASKTHSNDRAGVSPQMRHLPPISTRHALRVLLEREWSSLAELNIAVTEWIFERLGHSLPPRVRLRNSVDHRHEGRFGHRDLPGGRWHGIPSSSAPERRAIQSTEKFAEHGISPAALSELSESTLLPMLSGPRIHAGFIRPRPPLECRSSSPRRFARRAATLRDDRALLL